MALLVILKPPSGAPAGCNTNIELHAERIDYTINNDIIHKRTGTQEGRAVQMISGSIQMNITCVVIPENGNTAMENVAILECAGNEWGHATSPSSLVSYPKVTWRLGDEYMLIQKVTFIDEGETSINEISCLVTLYLDTRT